MTGAGQGPKEGPHAGPQYRVAKLLDSKTEPRWVDTQGSLRGTYTVAVARGWSGLTRTRRAPPVGPLWAVPAQPGPIRTHRDRGRQTKGDPSWASARPRATRVAIWNQSWRRRGPGAGTRRDPAIKVMHCRHSPALPGTAVRPAGRKSRASRAFRAFTASLSRGPSGTQTGRDRG